MNATLARYTPWMLGILRIVTALVFMEHGTQKLFHFPPMPQFGGAGRAAVQAVKGAGDAAVSALSSVADTAMATLSSAAHTLDASSTAVPAAGPPGGMPASMQATFLIAGIIETFGGLALVLGLFTRPIAFIVAGETAVVFWWMHFGRSGNIFPVSNGGEAAVLFCFTFLYLVFAGPGAFALDGMMGRKQPA